MAAGNRPTRRPPAKADPRRHRIYGLKHISRVCPAGKRPRCLWCDQPLKPKLEWVGLPGKPQIAWFAIEPSKQARAWVRLEDGVVKVWCGEYYGDGDDGEGTPLFCGFGCAGAFAQDAYRHGFRAELRGRRLTRERKR